MPAAITLPAPRCSQRWLSPSRFDPADVHVIDADTIRVYHRQPNVRLVGFNAPETRCAACEAERELGGKATRRVRDSPAAVARFVLKNCAFNAP